MIYGDYFNKGIFSGTHHMIVGIHFCMHTAIGHIPPKEFSRFTPCEGSSLFHITATGRLGISSAGLGPTTKNERIQ